MIVLKDLCYLCETVEDLFEIPDFEHLYADAETSSRNRNLTSINPWHHCWPLGIAITGDNYIRCWYVPWTLCVQNNWLQNKFDKAKSWTNHNIKYDMHVLANHGVSIPKHLICICTQAGAHLIDSDRTFKGGYTLDALAKAWLSKEYRKKGNLLAPYLKDNKDYGNIPIDILAYYACFDVKVNRALQGYILKHMPEESDKLYANEICLTKVLWRMERTGLCINPAEVQIAEFACLRRMLDIEDKLQKQLGYCVNPDSRKQLFDLICNRFGQPVRKWTNVDHWGNRTDKSNPSFDKDALQEYITSIETPKELKGIIKLLLKYRVESQHRSMFYEPWQKLHIEGVLHSQYNQNLRTGRLSCKQPNAQQLDKLVKALIHPPDGFVFLSFDQSQVEYRIIVHYINAIEAIRAYRDNPDTDFHNWVADMCTKGLNVQIRRRPAKTVNFSVSFGIGVRKMRANLVAILREEGIDLTDNEAANLADNIRAEYHRNLPTLKRTTDHAEALAKRRGYIRNLAGRRLHLPGPHHNVAFTKEGKQVDRCHIALCGRAVQGTAADICKFQSVSIQPLLRKLNAELVALVHDEYLFQLPWEGEDVLYDKANQIRDHLEICPFPLRVPLRVSGGWSRESWAMADEEVSPIPRRGREKALTQPLP